MIESLVTVLVVALVLCIVFWGAGQFITGTPLKIIGLILGLIFVLYALRELGLLKWVKGA